MFKVITISINNRLLAEALVGFSIGVYNGEVDVAGGAINSDLAFLEDTDQRVALFLVARQGGLGLLLTRNGDESNEEGDEEDEREVAHDESGSGCVMRRKKDVGICENGVSEGGGMDRVRTDREERKKRETTSEAP